MLHNGDFYQYFFTPFNVYIRRLMIDLPEGIFL